MLMTQKLQKEAKNYYLKNLDVNYCITKYDAVKRC